MTCNTGHIDPLNYIAIEFLEILGNKSPSQTQIDLMESLLFNLTRTHELREFLKKSHKDIYILVACCSL